MTTAAEVIQSTVWARFFREASRLAPAEQEAIIRVAERDPVFGAAFLVGAQKALADAQQQQGLGFLDKVGDFFSKSVGRVTDVVKNAAPLAPLVSLIPGVGPAASAALTAVSGGGQFVDPRTGAQQFVQVSGGGDVPPQTVAKIRRLQAQISESRSAKTIAERELAKSKGTVSMLTIAAIGAGALWLFSRRRR
ncbi:MAG: hypothetical protein AAGJ54_05800 [Planctomycetota bacterium]